jgi:hypothetical protein
MVQYSFTLRKTKDNKNATQDMYYSYFAKYRIHGLHLNLCYFENTSGLHAHGVIDIPNDFNTKLFRVYGWNIKYDLIYNYTEWVRYCQKEILNNEMEEIQKYTRCKRILPMIGPG